VIYAVATACLVGLIAVFGRFERQRPYHADQARRVPRAGATFIR
jgi:hypothetical protein